MQPVLLLLLSALFATFGSCLFRSSEKNRVHILKYFGKKQAKVKPFEDSNCQSAWCLYGSSKDGYCHKCATSAALDSHNTCRRLEILSQIRLTRFYRYAPQTLLVIPGSAFISEPGSTLAAKIRDIDLPAPHLINQCKQRRGWGGGQPYLFEATVGAMLKKSKNVTWTKKNPTAAKRRYGIAWGSDWNFPATHLSGFRKPDEGNEKVFTLFPEAAVESFGKKNDLALLYLNRQYYKTSDSIDAVSKKLFVSQFDLVRPGKVVSSESQPTVSLLKILQVPELPTDDAPPVLKDIIKSSCVIISCEANRTSQRRRRYWLARTKKAFQSFMLKLEQAYPTAAKARQSENLAHQVDWMMRLLTRLRFQLQELPTVSSEELKAQDDTGEWTGLSSTCREETFSMLKARREAITAKYAELTKDKQNNNVLKMLGEQQMNNDLHISSEVGELDAVLGDVIDPTHQLRLS